MRTIQSQYIIRVRFRYLGCATVRPYYFDSLPEAIRFHVCYLNSYMRFDSEVIRLKAPVAIQVLGTPDTNS